MMRLYNRKGMISTTPRGRAFVRENGPTFVKHIRPFVRENGPSFVRFN